MENKKTFTIKICGQTEPNLCCKTLVSLKDQIILQKELYGNFHTQISQKKTKETFQARTRTSKDLKRQPSLYVSFLLYISL